tara:strand:- start:4365 stop:4679 length:315 start_codon:yes stop_codon:yes gene_type:complete
LKYIVIIFTLLLSFFAAFISGNQKNKAEVVISVNNLNSPSVISFLEEDFNKQSGIKFIDGSLMANTIVLEVEDNDIEISTLNDLLENWGCTIESISYRILSSIK